MRSRRKAESFREGVMELRALIADGSGINNGASVAGSRCKNSRSAYVMSGYAERR